MIVEKYFFIVIDSYKIFVCKWSNLDQFLVVVIYINYGMVEYS